MKINTIIYCSTWERGEEQFEKIMKNLLNNNPDVIVHKQRKGSYAINRSMMGSWRVLCPLDNARGYKWDYALIDEELPLRTYHEVILPQRNLEADSLPTEKVVSFF